MTVGVNIHIERDNSQFQVSKLRPDRTHDQDDCYCLDLIPYQACAFMTRNQLLILRDQLTEFLERGQ